MIAVARSLGEADVTEVLFSGGEPFLARDFMQIVSAIDPDRTNVYIASNGTALRSDTIAQLKRARVAGVDISIDGHTAELHQVVRLHPTSFVRAIRGIRACVEAEIPLRVTGVLAPHNAEYAEDFIEMLVGLGVTNVVLQTVLPSGGRAIEHPDLALPAAALPRVEERVERARSRWKGKIEIDFRAGKTGGGADGCPGGTHLVNIASNGDVSTCSWLYKLSPERFTLGNIKQHSLAESLGHIGATMSPWTSRTPCCPIPLVEAATAGAASHVHP